MTPFPAMRQTPAKAAWPSSQTHTLTSSPPPCAHKTEPRRPGLFCWGKGTNARHCGAVSRRLRRRIRVLGKHSSTKPGAAAPRPGPVLASRREPGGPPCAPSAVGADARVSRARPRQSHSLHRAPVAACARRQHRGRGSRPLEPQPAGSQPRPHAGRCATAGAELPVRVRVEPSKASSPRHPPPMCRDAPQRPAEASAGPQSPPSCRRGDSPRAGACPCRELCILGGRRVSLSDMQGINLGGKLWNPANHFSRHGLARGRTP